MFFNFWLGVCCCCLGVVCCLTTPVCAAITCFSGGSFSHLQGGIDGDSEDERSENGDIPEKLKGKDAVSSGKEDLEEKDKHQLKHRELFLSRQVETLPATHIRGKCAVTLLNETESLLSYLSKDVSWYWWLIEFLNKEFVCYIYVYFVGCFLLFPGVRSSTENTPGWQGRNQSRLKISGGHNTIVKKR